jgi:hypothetical protein
LQVGLFDCTLSTIATSTYPIAETHLDPSLVARLVFAGIEEVTAKAQVDPASAGLVRGPVRRHGAPRGRRAALRRQRHTLAQAELWRGAGLSGRSSRCSGSASVPR